MPGTIQENIKFQGTYQYNKPKKIHSEILSDLYVGNMVNENFLNYGLDTKVDADNRKVLGYDDYPYDIVYKFNSRGFRDKEWPHDLSECIWVVGDSHTMGIGLPEKFIFTMLLEKLTGKTVINCGFYSAFNIWISLAAQNILKEIKPKNLIVGWTHLSKKIRPDEPFEYSVEQLIHFQKCFNLCDVAKTTSNVIYLSMPNTLKQDDMSYFHKYKNYMGLVNQIDAARDGFHIGIETHKKIAADLSRFIC